MSLRPGHHQQPTGSFPYGNGNPAELASNLQHLQHLHSVQQQIAAAAAAAAAAGASSYWTSLKSSALTNGTNGRDGGLDPHPPSWRYDQQHHVAPLSSSPLSGKGYLGVGIESASSNPVGLIGSSKRKRSMIGSEDADEGDRCGHNSAASFNQDGKLLLTKGSSSNQFSLPMQLLAMSQVCLG